MRSSQDRFPHSPPQTEPSESKTSSQSSFRDFVSCPRRWLCAIAVVLILIMGVGIVVAAHHYYVDFGGQGYLKSRKVEAIWENEAAKVYLPLRKIATFGDCGRQIRRSPVEVPYYACGDQQSSCEAYNQPVSQKQPPPDWQKS